MNTTPGHIADSIFRERLRQAKRVMEGLSEQQRSSNFDIGRYAIQSDHGVIACIAGHCGLDPWFQKRGFVTDVANDRVSMFPGDFFGIERPFFHSFYGRSQPVTFEDALVALDRAIDLFADGTSSLKETAI